LMCRRRPAPGVKAKLVLEGAKGSISVLPLF